MALKTDYKDEVLSSSQPYRTYNIIDSNGSPLYSGVRINRADTPQQEGSKFGASDINTTNGAINSNTAKNETQDKSIETLRKDVSDIKKDVLLWSGSQNGYTINITLNSSPLQFKWIIIECVINNNHYYAVCPVINYESINNGMALSTYTMLTIEKLIYTPSNKNLQINAAVWVNQQNNSPITVVAVYGRY